MPRDSEFFSVVIEAPGRFSAYACDASPTQVHALPQAKSFADAALDFAELWHGEGPEMRVVVIDEKTGREQCFTVDLTGEA